MDPGLRSPLIDFFRRGEVAADVRLLAAQGALAPRALEQIALLVLLFDDPEPAVRGAARETIARLPDGLVAGFLARRDVPDEIREFFRSRGIEPADSPGAEPEEPLVDAGGDGHAEADGEAEAGTDPDKPLSLLPILTRLKLAMKGTREQRAILIRDSNKMVAAAVLSCPKLTESEVEAFARMGNVSEDVLRIIGMNRAWTKNYMVMAALVRNPKTPPAISMPLVSRLNDRDIKMLAIDRNVPEPLRLAARKFLVAGTSRKH